ncbi:MAG: glutamate racemase [Clostridium sp.]|nr:glutamate racemase [Clostridium sp.]
MTNKNPVGFFDSGVGGISVLKKAMELLPDEDFVYYGDSLHAPYGDKDVETIKIFSKNATEFLLSHHCKAIVVACNTATSAAVEDLRITYAPLPIIGIEPALKVAIEKTISGDILVLATNRTLVEEKFETLLKRYQQNRTISTLALQGLVEIIEEGVDIQEKAYEYLSQVLPNENSSFSAVVLGCTHYPFVIPSLKRIFPSHTMIVDGSEGTAKRLKEVLTSKNLLNFNNPHRKIMLCNSSPHEEMIHLSKKLLETDYDK